MNKIQVCLLLLTSFWVTNVTKAQNIDDGKKLMYYEKYKSAKAIFEKVVTANPNNADAVYWLGQSMILPDDNDIPGAKALYQQTLAANSNSPLLIAGMGHIELLEGKAQDARSRFETAISLSQGKSIPVLNAIGFANVQTKNGDAAYAVDKLKLATTLKGFKDPDVYVNLGDAYRKMGDGGSAQQSYEAALRLDANYARASYRIGKLYQTQGTGQQDIYMRYFNEAIAKDPNYAPVYENLYLLFYNTDVVKSGEYLEKYLAIKKEDETNGCYLRASMKYAQGLFNETITEADKCMAGVAQPYPNLYGLKGYAYNRLGDSANAKASFDLYFQKQKPEKIGPTDYSTYAAILLKFPGNDSLVNIYADKAVELDTTEAGKVNQLKSIAANYESRKQYKEAGDWYKKILNVKKNITKTDLYNAGYSYYRSGNFQPAIDVFNMYTQKFPDDIFGYYMIGKSSWGIDTTMEQSLANPAFEKAISIGEAITDSVAKSKVKNQLVGSYKYMIAYAANIKKDKNAALALCDKALMVDPNDQELIRNREAISKMKTGGATGTGSGPAKNTGTKPAEKPKPTGGKTGGAGKRK